MNYRHAFHAGNHCDVLKHAALCLVLQRLSEKQKPFAVLDTHAGRGLYDLGGPEAARSGEHLGGIARILDDPAAPAALRPYLDAIRRQNPFGALRWYPGSPVLIREALRAEDRAKFCELHPEEFAALEAAVANDARVRLFPRDGYEAIRAFLPPSERRGLVHIDPPFEQRDEYEKLVSALKDGMKRFANGISMIWRPVKDEAGYASFLARARALDIGKTLQCELNVLARTEDKLTGSGLFIVNPPFGLAPALEECLRYLARRLQKGSGAGWSLIEEEAGRTVHSGGETLA